LALMRHVTLGGFHQTRNQIVAAVQLHINLRECILVTVARRDQPVVADHHRNHYDDGDNYNNPDHASAPKWTKMQCNESGHGRHYGAAPCRTECEYPVAASGQLRI